MAKSMTGFGQGKKHQNQWQCHVEIRSVNQRFLDIRLRLPNGFAYLENDLKADIREVCARGKVECTFSLDMSDTLQNERVLNQELAQNYVKVLQEFQKLTDFPLSVQFADLLAAKELITTPEPEVNNEELESLFHETLAEALEQIDTMRSHEGARLLEDMQSRLKQCESILTQIEHFSKDLPQNYYQRLKNSVANLDSSLEYQEERLHQEMALLADKVDITEEIVRFRTHLKHASKIVKGEGIGKKIDFLLQEMNREVNTIASKSSSAEISQLVVEIKSELERVREQVQNLE